MSSTFFTAALATLTVTASLGCIDKSELQPSSSADAGGATVDAAGGTGGQGSAAATDGGSGPDGQGTAACACVPRHGVAVLACGADFPAFAGHDAPQAMVSAIGNAVVFNRCALGANGGCVSELVRWTPSLGAAKLADAWGYAVSADGTMILADTGDATGVSRPVLWRQGTFIDLGLGGAYAHLLSADGSVVAARIDTGTTVTQAALWTSSNGVTPLGDLPGGADYSEPEAINGDGSVVVGYGNIVGGQEPFAWTAGGGMVDLGVLTEVEQTIALAMSSDGSVVVGTSLTDSGTMIFRWTAGGGMVGLALHFENVPGPSPYQFLWTPPLLESSDGQVVAGTASNPANPQLPEAFRWTAATDLVALTAADASIVRSATSDGSRILGARLSGGSMPALAGLSQVSYAPFVWDESHGAQDLAGLLGSAGTDLAGLTLGDPIAISADGSTVVGHASCGGDAVIYQATLPP